MASDSLDLHLPFVQVKDTSDTVHVINTRQIVRIQLCDEEWVVYFTVGSNIVLSDAESRYLRGKLPGTPQSAGVI